MSLLLFFKQKDELPEPRGTLLTSVTGTLLTSITDAARAQANQEVQILPAAKSSVECIRNTSLIFVPKSAASLPFSRKLSKCMSEMTVRFIGSAYLEYFTNSCFPYLAIDVVAMNTAGSSVYVFDRGCHRVLDRSNVRTREKNNDETKCKIISV